MSKVTDIEILNIDDTQYEVAKLPEEVRDLVDIYNDWNRKEAVVHDELTRFQAAKDTLSRQIVSKVRELVVDAQPPESEVDTAEKTPVDEEVDAEVPVLSDEVVTDTKVGGTTTE